MQIFFLHDVERGDIALEEGKTFREYITQYQSDAKNNQIQTIAEIFGLDETKLNSMMMANINEFNINEYGHFDELKDTVDKSKAKEYFEKIEKESIPPFKINIKVHNLLQKLILSGGFDLDT